jgi:pimeloyl-ACP methyl ester carboxylesterase
MDGTGDLFGPFVKALGDQFKIQIIRYAPNLEMGYPELLACVSAQLPKNESFVLLGESFSGPIAVQLSALQNPNLLGLVLCCTFVRNPRPTLSWCMPLINLMPFVKPPKRLLSYLLLGKQSTPALQTDLQAAAMQVTAQVMKVRLAAVIGVDVTNLMATIKVPILYLQANDDRLVPNSASSQICSANPKTQMVEIDGPHCLLQAAPLNAAKVVLDWLKSIR